MHHAVQVIDSHTGGEPTRVVVGGGPDLGGGSAGQQLEIFRERFDRYRCAIVNEPRGSDVLVGALLLPPSDPACAAGLIFFNNVGYLGMCGHGTIGVVATLARLGRIGAGEHRLETPVGMVTTTLHADDTVSVENVPSYRKAKDVMVDVPQVGKVTGDVAWGGNWFFLVRGEESLHLADVERLTDKTRRIRQAINAAGFPEVDHVELFGPPAQAMAQSRNFVLCPGNAYDRSPCGTGTSAKLACLAADGKLAEGEPWVQESVLGSTFTGRYRWLDRGAGHIAPTITGRAFIIAETTLVFEETDPFRWGIQAGEKGAVSRHVVIVGGGIIGLCTAYYAALRGWRVTVVERGGPERDGCSFGNAGLVVPSHIVPLAAPGMVQLGLKWMLQPEAPFHVKPRLSWDLLRWGWHFCRAATPSRVRRAAPLLRDLGLASRACYEDLAAALPAGFGLTHNGLLMLCKTEHALHEEAKTAAAARRLGLDAEVVDARRIAALEPDLRIDAVGGVFFSQDCHLQPGRLMSALQDLLIKYGVDFRWDATVRDWRARGRTIAGLLTTKDEITADQVVFASGAWSGRLGRRLGLDLPMQPGKGYSLTLPGPRQMPRRGLICVEARLAVTPLGDSVRFGGTMELGGLNHSISPRRVRGILHSIPAYFPELRAEDFNAVQPWCGLRPCSPDGLPYLGRAPRWDNLIVATGHAMLGVSLGPITGKIVAALLAGERPSVDLRLLRPERFAATV